MSKEHIEEKHELSESIYMSGHGLDWKDSDDIAEQLYHEGYRKHVEGEWIDRYNGKYANSLYVCSLCGKRAPLDIKANELGNEQMAQMLSQFCPNCGAKMVGRR
jgi:DNA-directed RNA polymerase subunit RPC12/RpoP